MKASLAQCPSMGSGAGALAAQTTLIVADGSCPKIRELLAEALTPVLWLEAGQDPLETVTAALVQRRQQGQPVETLHWVSHGRPGVLQVGATAVNGANLLANAYNLASWGVCSLALWSCQAGADRRFITLWEELTGASVWSSSGVLGRLEDGSSDWSLTSSSATAAPALPVAAAQQQAWSGQLTSTSTTTNGLGDNAVYGVYASGSTVYAATAGGLSISTDGGASFTNFTTANGLGNNSVTGIYESGGTIYAATFFGGLSISTDGGASFTNFTTANGLGDNVVAGIYESGGTVYAATLGGLSISTDGGTTFTNRTNANGLGTNTVYGVYAIGNTVYAATTGGLSISTDGGGSFTNFTTANGLADNTVYSVYAIGSTVYAATAGGLSISSAPTLTSSTPADDATGVAVGSDLVLIFSENISAGTGNILIKKSSDSTTAATIPIGDPQVSISGSTLTINPTTDLDAGTDYYLEIASGVIQNTGFNIYSGLATSTALNFTTAAAPDTTAPTLTSSTPADDATSVAIGSNLVLNFSETIAAGSGNIIIKKSDGTAVATISVTDTSQVTISGSTATINPTADLDYSTGYYVDIASGVFQDTAGNNYAGITSATTLDFTTDSASSGGTGSSGSSGSSESTPTQAASSAPAANTTPIDPANAAGANIQSTDNDGDGIREVISAPDGTTVDGNRDGIADAEQTEVAGLRLINDGALGSDYGAVQVSTGTQLSAVTLISPDAETGVLAVTGRDGTTALVELPQGISNNFAGAVAFDVSGLEIGGSTNTTINLPTGLQVDSANSAYMRFNYLTNQFEEYVDAQGNPLYTLQDSNGDGTPDAVVLVLKDGDQQWDGDGVANGKVQDPGFLGNGQRNFTGTKQGDTLTGNVLANTMNGKAGRDWLQGDLGRDALFGGRDKDRLWGGHDADVIKGGKDRDRILYYSVDESTADQADTVTFGKNDRFKFLGFDGNTITEGQQSLRYIGKKPFSGSAGELRFTGRGLQADTTGDGQADFVVNFTKATPWFSEANILI